MMEWQFKKYDLDAKHIDIVGYIPPTRNNDSDEKQVRSSEKKQSSWSTLTQEQKDFYNRQRAGFRMKSKIRRSIIRHNMRYMWTLTFKSKFILNGNGKTKDTGNLKDVWELWSAFLKRCERKGLKFKYIVTLELHEKRLQTYGERVYHFHFCTDTFIHHSQKTASKFGAEDVSKNMADIWGHGFVFATNFSGNSRSAAAAYLTKYITKSFEEIEEKGARRYRISEGLAVEGVQMEPMHEIEMDAYVFELAKKKNCFFKKSYQCLDAGDIEILIYTIFPKTKKLIKEMGKKKNARINSQSKVYSRPSIGGQIALPI